MKLKIAKIRTKRSSKTVDRATPTEIEIKCTNSQDKNVKMDFNNLEPKQKMAHLRQRIMKNGRRQSIKVSRPSVPHLHLVNL